MWRTVTTVCRRVCHQVPVTMREVAHAAAVQLRPMLFALVEIKADLQVSPPPLNEQGLIARIIAQVLGLREEVRGQHTVQRSLMRQWVAAARRAPPACWRRWPPGGACKCASHSRTRQMNAPPAIPVPEQCTHQLSGTR